jgi:hypothetical protein
MNTPNESQDNPLGTRTPPAWTPPPIPPPQPRGRPQRPDEEQRAAFTEDFKPLDNVTPSAVTDALLKRPARLAHELLHGRASSVRISLLGVSIAGLLVYGVVMACFSGGAQFWAVPIKLLSGVFLSAAICIPSLYILTALSGSRLTLGDVWGLLLTALALSSLLLAGFAPVAWLFSQSTGTAAWMGLLHLLLWVAALAFGYRLLKAALEHTGGRQIHVLRLWAVVFLAVLFQMSTVLRPMVGPFKPLQVGEKRFFVQHWVDCMD